MLNSYKIHQLIKFYKLPLAATVVFVLVLSAFLLIRAQENRVLSNLLTPGNNNENGYANLLSTDNLKELKPNSSESVPNSETSNQSGSTSKPTQFTISPNLAPPPSNTKNPGSTPSPQPFSANILNIRYESQDFVCEPNSTGITECFKKYFFGSSIRTINGPGLVTYSWRSNEGSNSNGSFSVGTGESYTSLKKETKISCNKPGNYQIQIELHSPNSAKSDKIEYSHSCTTPVSS